MFELIAIYYGSVAILFGVGGIGALVMVKLYGTQHGQG